MICCRTTSRLARTSQSLVVFQGSLLQSNQHGFCFSNLLLLWHHLNHHNSLQFNEETHPSQHRFHGVFASHQPAPSCLNPCSISSMLLFISCASKCQADKLPFLLPSSKSLPHVLDDTSVPHGYQSPPRSNLHMSFVIDCGQIQHTPPLFASSTVVS